MKFYKIIFISSLLLNILSCKNKKEISFDNADITIIRCQNCSEEISKHIPPYNPVNFIPLETTSACLITNIQQIAIKDTFIYIKDSHHTLYAFNKDGKFIRRVGNIGRGPGDYIRLNSFYIDHINNNIIIIDGVNNNFIKYELNGKYISYEKIPEGVNGELIRKAILTEDNELLLYNSINPHENMAYTIINMKTKELIGNYFSYSPINLRRRDIFSFNAMCETNGNISLLRPLNDTIYQYNSSKFSAKYIIQTPAKIPPSSAINGTEDSYQHILKNIRDKDYFPGFKDIIETPDHLLLTFIDELNSQLCFLADKRKNQGYYFRLNFLKEYNKIPFYSAMASHENNLISAVEPRNLLARNYKFDENDELGKKFQIMLENLDEQDNPVLIFYELQ